VPLGVEDSPPYPFNVGNRTAKLDSLFSLQGEICLKSMKKTKKSMTANHCIPVVFVACVKQPTGLYSLLAETAPNRGYF
jgi:hypothetical protein